MCLSPWNSTQHPCIQFLRYLARHLSRHRLGDMQPTRQPQQITWECGRLHCKVLVFRHPCKSFHLCRKYRLNNPLGSPQQHNLHPHLYSPSHPKHPPDTRKWTCLLWSFYSLNLLGAQPIKLLHKNQRLLYRQSPWSPLEYRCFSRKLPHFQPEIEHSISLPQNW